MRRKKVVRDTKETKIVLALEIDGTGAYEINTGSGFLDHMMELFARHGRFDLAIDCNGDTQVDYHHTTEDIGIALGTAFKESLGDKRGITRYGTKIIPMDETLVLVSVDISGRTYVGFDVEMPAQKVGDFDTELVKEFILGMARAMDLTIHVKLLEGENTHHIIEGIFKCMGRALREACAIEEEYADEIPSTKGVL